MKESIVPIVVGAAAGGVTTATLTGVAFLYVVGTGLNTRDQTGVAAAYTAAGIGSGLLVGAIMGVTTALLVDAAPTTDDD